MLPTLKNNQWLTDSNFINQTRFKDKYYLSSIGEELKKFVHKCPLPIVIKWDDFKLSLFVLCGNAKKEVKIDDKINSKDYATILQNWLYPLYPHYDYQVTTNRIPTKEEMSEMVATGEVSVDDVFNHKITSTHTEIGIMEKVYFLDEQFRMVVYTQREGEPVMFTRVIRQSTLPISKFLKEMRANHSGSDQDLYNYIYENSVEVQVLNEPRIIVIDYPQEQLLMFVKINAEKECPDLELTNIENRYKWGQFEFDVTSPQLLKEIQQVIATKGK